MPDCNEDELNTRNNGGSKVFDDIDGKISELHKSFDEVKALRLQLVKEKSKLSLKSSSDNSVVENQQESMEKVVVTNGFCVCVNSDDDDDDDDCEESDSEISSNESGEIQQERSSKTLVNSELGNRPESTENVVANSSRVNGDDEYDSEETSSDEDNHSVMDDSEGNDDARSACFPCPFCYVDIEVHLLCSHLQEEHCFDLKNAVCPLCAANLGKDVIGHFIAQHASSLKRKRKSQKSGFLTGSSAMLGKELSLFLGSSTNGRGNAHESAPDPLLSPFLCSVPLSDPKGIRQDECSNNSAPVTSDLKSSELSLLDEYHEQDNEERRQRAAFVQELIVSTIF